MHITFASAILLLLQLDHISGLQQSPTSSAFASRPISFQKQSTCLWSASVTDVVDETSSDLRQDQLQIAYDWDEQFEELQSFMAKYGHCNFPQNPPKQLKQKYPLLKTFCHDQRIEYKQLQIRKHGGYKLQSLATFDRSIRCRVLEELGFEFNQAVAQWYDHYHELIQYFRENGHIRVTTRDNTGLAKWVYSQRCRRKGIENYARLSESQIKLLDDIGFEWKPEPHVEHWNAKYKELVAFRNKHGHVMVDYGSPLYDWMRRQRQRRADQKRYGAITDEQVRLLDEIDFPWKSERNLSKWYAMYYEMQRFQKEHGHCQTHRSTHKKLHKWSFDQREKYRNGNLSAEEIKLLDKLGFPWELNRTQWTKMLNELTEYFNTNGHLHVNEDDDPDLYDWMAVQRNRYHDMAEPAMPDEQIEKLEEIQFCWSLYWRERTWHEKYIEVAEFFKDHGHVRLTKKENPSLCNWIETQGKRYKELKGQKPLSEEELEMLEQIDFPFFEGQPRMAWNAMYAEVRRFREDNDGRFPISHKDDPDLSRWMRQQRHRYRQEYGYAPLSEAQKSLLESINFPIHPKGKHKRRWYEKYDELVDFWKQHGHFLVERSKDAALLRWTHKQRVRFHGNSVLLPLSKSQLYLLERIGFSWTSDRNGLAWQKNYEEVVEFLEVRGHFPTPSDNRKLATWMVNQRQDRKGNLVPSTELNEDRIQKLDKIGFRW